MEVEKSESLKEHTAGERLGLVWEVDVDRLTGRCLRAVGTPAVNSGRNPPFWHLLSRAGSTFWHQPRDAPPS